jgi:hypothetical protein
MPPRMPWLPPPLWESEQAACRSLERMPRCRLEGEVMNVPEGNPYAPPAAGFDAGPPSTELSLSQAGQATVDSLAQWMRIVSIFFYVFAGLMGVMALLSLFGGAMGLVMMILAGGFAVLMVMAGTWLRDAARQFSHGVTHNEEICLGQGFRALRSFFIMYGIFNIIGLVKSIWDATNG